VRNWFVARMLGLIEQAEHDASSFYARFVSFDPPQRREFAVSVWEQINLPNLQQHIAPSHDNATHTVRLDADHLIIDVAPRSSGHLTRGTW
jgi:type I pantothenate kinase